MRPLLPTAHAWVSSGVTVGLVGSAVLGVTVAAAPGALAGAGSPGFLGTGIVSTLAGSGVSRTTAGVGAQASFGAPSGVVAVGGYVYVRDSDAISRVDPVTGDVSILAGVAGQPSCVDGPTGAASSLGGGGPMATDGVYLYTANSACGVRETSLVTGATTTLVGSIPAGVGGLAVGPDGTVYLSPGLSTSNAVYAVDVAGHALQTFATLPQGTRIYALAADQNGLYMITTMQYQADQIQEVSWGSTVAVPFVSDSQLDATVLVSAGGYLLVSAFSSLREYDKSDGSSHDVAGAGTGHVDGRGADAWFDRFTGLAWDGSAAVYLTDNANYLRVVTSAGALPASQPPGYTSSVAMDIGDVITLAGTGSGPTSAGHGRSAGFRGPTGLAVSGGDLYVADVDGVSVVDLKTAAVSVLAGPNNPSLPACQDAPTGATATFGGPTVAIATDDYYVYLAGGTCRDVRRVSRITGATSTVAGPPHPGTITALTVGPGGVLYGIEALNVTASLVRIDSTTNSLQTVLTLSAGQTISGFGLAADSDGIYISYTLQTNPNVPGVGHLDFYSFSDGSVTALYTNPNSGLLRYYGGPMVSAGQYVYGVARLPSATGGEAEVLVAFDKQAPGLHYVAGSDNGYADGAGPAAEFDSINGITTDGVDLYVTDGGNHIRKVIPTLVQGGWPGEQIGGYNLAQLPVGCSCADPVDPMTGALTEPAADVSVPGRGPALSWSRTYDSSQAAALGPLGYGWAGSYNDAVVVDPYEGSGALASSPMVDVVQENGSRVPFTLNADGSYSAPSRVLATLTRNADGSWTFVRRKTSTFTFDTTGRLTLLSDRNGYVTTLSYDGAGRLAKVTDASERTLTLSYGGNGLISAVTDPLGQVTAYGYDNAKDLTTATDPAGNVTSYVYDAAHKMTSKTSPGSGVTTTTYDADDRVLSQTDPLGHASTFDYGLATGFESGTVTMFDPLNVATQMVFDSGKLIAITHAAGTEEAATTTYEYDPVTDGTTRVTDPAGDITTATYDSAGNQTSATDADGHTTTSTYDGYGDLTSRTTPRGVTTDYGHDAHGNLTSVTVTGAGLSVSASNTYADPAHPGDVTASTDADGRTTTYGYDAYGDATSTTDPAGDVTIDTYNLDGRLTSEVAPRGNVAGADPADYTTSYGYDAAGRPAAVTDPLGHTTSYGYDADGNKTSVTDPTGEATSYRYDVADHLTTVTAPDGTTTSYGYDADGHKTSAADAAGHTTTFGYDHLGRLITVTDPLGHVTTSAYDLAGRLTSVTSANGGVTSYSYDPAGQLLSTTSPTGGVTSYGYDADGHRTSVTDPDGHVTSFGFDGIGRPTSTTNPGGTVEHQTLDAAGQLLSYTQPIAPAAPTPSLPGGGGADPAPAPAQTPAAAGLSNPYPSAVLADGPSIFYRLDDATGSASTTDSSGSGNDATVDPSGVSLGQPGALPDESDAAAGFAGGLARESSGAGLPVGNADRSVEAWFKTTNTGHQVITWWGSQNDQQQVEVGTDAGRQIYLSGQYDDARFSAGYSIADGTWHHLVLTYAGATQMVTAYLDGQRLGAQVLPHPLDTTLDATGLTVGGPECDCYTFNGSLDDVAIYPAVLSATQVAAHYAASGYPTAGAPQQPTAVQTTTGTNQVAVAWTAPASGAPVDHYLVSVAIAGQPNVTLAAAGDQTTALLTGLPGGTPMTAQVVAVNSDGASAAAASASFTVSGPAATYPAQVRADHPAVFYRLDEAATTTTVADSSGNGRDATNTVEQGLGLGGATDPVAAEGASAASTGSGETQLGSGAGLPTGNADRSIEAWFKTTNTAHQVLTWWGTDAPDQEMELGFDNGDQIYLTGEYNEARFTTAASLADNTWHHLVVTYDASALTVKAYLDGALVGSQQLAGGPWNTTLDTTGLVVGGPEYHGYYFTGSLADVAIYRSTLTAQQVAIHYRAGTFGGLATTTYSYDAAGRQTSVADPDGRITRFGYDADSEQISVADAAGQVTSYGYDAAGRLTTVAYPDQAPTSFGYDAAGRRVTMTDGTGTSSYGYDGYSRLVSVSDGAGATVGYTYDSLSRIVAITYPDGRVVSRGFDATGQLVSVADGSGNSVSFGYDADGNNVTSSFPGGVADTATLDAADQVTGIGIAASGGSLATFGYTLTPAGLAATASDSLQPATQSYTYSPTDQLTGVGDSSAGFGYGTIANLTALPDGSALGYDPAGQLTTAAHPDGSTTSYGYDSLGRRVVAATTSAGTTSTLGYGLDAAGHLTASTDAAGTTTSYTYNGDGLRTAVTSGGVTRPEVWDSLTGGLPLLVNDGSDDYVYGPDGTPVEQIDQQTGVAVFLHTDRLGSTRLLTDTTGAVVATYSYSPYGAVVSHAGTATTPLQYTGQYTDPTGLIYLRARYYDPATAQFLTRDPIEALTQQPYQYAHGDPLDETDPSGLGCGWTSPWDCGPSLQQVGDWAAGFGDTVTFGGTKQIRRLINYEQTGDTSDIGVDQCDDFYHWGNIGGDVANVFDSIVVPGTIIKWLGPAAPIVGRGGILFGRGGSFGAKGILNRGYVRLGWGWKGSQAAGQDVFRMGIGGPGRSVWTHIDFF